ncbi:Protein of unknown function, partial [Gryllus bimaculatus]
ALGTGQRCAELRGWGGRSPRSRLPLPPPRREPRRAERPGAAAAGGQRVPRAHRGESSSVRETTDCCSSAASCGHPGPPRPAAHGTPRPSARARFCLTGPEHEVRGIFSTYLSLAGNIWDWVSSCFW